MILGSSSDKISNIDFEGNYFPSFSEEFAFVKINLENWNEHWIWFGRLEIWL